MKLNITKLALAITLLLGGTAHTSKGQGPVTKGLIAHYCMDGNANDAVSGKNGTVYGATLTTDRLGRPGRAYEFDGLDDFIQVPNDVWFGGDFTVTGWLYVPVYKDFGKFFDFSNGAPGDNVMYSPTPTAYVGDAFIIRKQTCVTTPMEESANTTPFPLATWVHVALVLRGTVGEDWRNGANVTTRSSTVLGPPCAVVRTQNYFGKSPWTHDAYFQGKMDDIRIYNRALSPSEIDSVFKSDVSCQPTSIAFDNKEKAEFLSQSIPNPGKGVVTINYELPTTFNTAEIVVHDLSGRVIRKYDLPKDQAGSISVQTNELSGGLYFYTLVADGQQLDRKKMIVSGN